MHGGGRFEKTRGTLLASLPGTLSGELFARATRVRLAEDELLFSAGDEGNGCYRIESGLLKLSILSSEGDERILDILGSGAVVGELSMIDGAPRSTAVYAVRDAELSFISRATFLEFADANPELYRQIAWLLAKRVRDMNDTAAAWSFLSLKGRTAQALLELAETFGENIGGGRILIRQKISQSDVAAMAGIARENVSRILNGWLRDKTLSRHSGYYCIEAGNALHEAAER